MPVSKNDMWYKNHCFWGPPTMLRFWKIQVYGKQQQNKKIEPKFKDPQFV